MSTLLSYLHTHDHEEALDADESPRYYALLWMMMQLNPCKRKIGFEMGFWSWVEVCPITIHNGTNATCLCSLCDNLIGF